MGIFGSAGRSHSPFGRFNLFSVFWFRFLLCLSSILFAVSD